MAPSTHDALPDQRNADVLVYIDGDFVGRDEAKVSVFDSGFLVGDGVWEGIRLHQGKLAFLDRHLDRLLEGAAAIALDIGMTRGEIEDLLYEVVSRNEMTDDAHIRLMVTRGRKKTASQHPANLAGGPTVVVIAEHKRPSPSVYEHGIDLFTSTVRRPPPDTLDQRLNSHSKLHEVVALIQAVEAGADEALMLDPTGAVATCNATNFFIVRSGEVWTSTGHYSLGGITRGIVIEICREEGVPVFQRPFSLTDVYGADEAFVTGTFGGLTPAVKVDGRLIGDGTPGPMTTRLRQSYNRRVEEETAS